MEFRFIPKWMYFILFKYILNLEHFSQRYFTDSICPFGILDFSLKI